MTALTEQAARDLRIYWPDNVEVICDATGYECNATDEDRLVSPAGRRVTPELGRMRPFHTTRHYSCDLADCAGALSFYLLARRPYHWLAVDSSGNRYTGLARTGLGLRLSVGRCSWAWVRAAHRAAP